MKMVLVNVEAESIKVDDILWICNGPPRVNPSLSGHKVLGVGYADDGEVEVHLDNFGIVRFNPEHVVCASLPVST